jgi:hypothetical protein
LFNRFCPKAPRGAVSFGKKNIFFSFSGSTTPEPQRNHPRFRNFGFLLAFNLQIYFTENFSLNQILSIFNQNTTVSTFPFFVGVSTFFQVSAFITAETRNIENITSPFLATEYNQKQVPKAEKQGGKNRLV